MNRRPTSLEKNVKFEQIERETSTCYVLIRFLLYVCGIVAIVGIEIFSAFSFEPSSSSTIFSILPDSCDLSTLPPPLFPTDDFSQLAFRNFRG